MEPFLRDRPLPGVWEGRAHARCTHDLANLPAQNIGSAGAGISRAGPDIKVSATANRDVLTMVEDFANCKRNLTQRNRWTHGFCNTFRSAERGEPSPRLRWRVELGSPDLAASPVHLLGQVARILALVDHLVGRDQPAGVELPQVVVQEL